MDRFATLIRLPRMLIGLCLVALATPGLVFAQSAVDEAPADRFIFGPVGLTPRIALRNVGMDTNPFNLPGDTDQDFTATIQPGVDSSLRIGRARLSGRECCFPRGADQVSGRAIGVAAGSAGGHHSDLAARPRSGILDRPPRSWVLPARSLEQVEDVLGARCRPQCEEPVISVGKGPAPANGHEARITNLRQDHVAADAPAAAAFALSQVVSATATVKIWAVSGIAANSASTVLRQALGRRTKPTGRPSTISSN